MELVVWSGRGWWSVMDWSGRFGLEGWGRGIADGGGGVGSWLGGVGAVECVGFEGG